VGWGCRSGRVSGGVGPWECDFGDGVKLGSGGTSGSF
jgi:hypothetical protein